MLLIRELSSPLMSWNRGKPRADPNDWGTHGIVDLLNELCQTVLSPYGVRLCCAIIPCHLRCP